MKIKPVNTSRIPVYRDAGFELYDADTTKNAFMMETDPEREPEIFIYSRYRNPTVIAAENEIMRLEQSKWALLAQSGMSAIDIALSAFQKGNATGPWLFFNEIYGGTISYIESVLIKRRGLSVFNFNPENEKYDIAEFERLIVSLKPELVYIETISNPMLIVADGEHIIKIAHKYGAKVIVDNTFATPMLWKPLQNEADIVIHSATKYLSGHGDITAGVLCGNDHDLMKSALEYRKFTGHMLSPDDAYRLNTHIQTFEIRFRQQCSNALNLCRVLKEFSSVRKIWYPGLIEHPTHSEAKKLFGERGFGGMITFDFAGNDDQEKKGRRDSFIKAVSGKIKLIPSLGDPTTMLMPVESVWGAKYPEPGMIRLSVGFEAFEELESAVRQGLKITE